MRWLLLCLLTAVSLAPAAPPKDLVQARLLADVKSIQPGSSFRMAVEFAIAPEWHIYWLNPGEGGLPTKAVLDLPKGLHAEPIQFPVPRAFDLPGGLTAYGYENRAVLLTTVRVDDDYAAANTTIGCDAVWLVCKDVCVAGKASSTLSLPLGEVQQDHADVFAAASAALPAPAWRGPGVGEITAAVALHADGKLGTLTVTVPWQKASPMDLTFFPPPADGLNFAKPTLTVGQHQTTIVTTFDVLAGQKPPTGVVESVLSWKHNAQPVGVTVPIHFESATPTAK